MGGWYIADKWALDLGQKYGIAKVLSDISGATTSDRLKVAGKYKFSNSSCLIRVSCDSCLVLRSAKSKSAFLSCLAK